MDLFSLPISTVDAYSLNHSYYITKMETFTTRITVETTGVDMSIEFHHDIGISLKHNHIHEHQPLSKPHDYVTYT